MLLTDRRPLDWTCYTGRPNPDPIYGHGVMQGYRRTSVYDTYKPQYPVSKFPIDTDIGGLEHEDGMIANGVVNHTDPRAYPKEAPGELAKLAVIAKAVRLSMAARFDSRSPVVPLFWYRPIMLRPGQPIDKFKAALRVQIDSGLFDVVDGLVIDAHPHKGEPFEVWRDLLDAQVLAIGEMTKWRKPMVALISEQWHPADGADRYKFLTESEALARYSHAHKHKNIWAVARFGGYDDVGGFRRLPLGSNPAHGEIDKVLTGVR